MFNSPFNDSIDESTAAVFRDIIFLALFGFMAIVLLILPHINPPTKNDDFEMPPPGNLVVEIFWEELYNIDIDLWVQAPGDNVVGYSSISGKLFNLLRDDLGYYYDVSSRNYEIALTRGLVSGEYTVNVMYFSNKNGLQSTIHPGRVAGGGAQVERREEAPTGKIYKPIELPILVEVVISVKKEDSEQLKRIISITVELWRVKEEVTAANFILDNQRDLIQESVNNVYKSLAFGTARD